MKKLLLILPLVGIITHLHGAQGSDSTAQQNSPYVKRFHKLVDSFLEQSPQAGVARFATSAFVFSALDGWLSSKGVEGTFLVGASAACGIYGGVSSFPAQSRLANLGMGAMCLITPLLAEKAGLFAGKITGDQAIKRYVFAVGMHIAAYGFGTIAGTLGKGTYDAVKPAYIRYKKAGVVVDDSTMTFVDKSDQP